MDDFRVAVSAGWVRSAGVGLTFRPMTDADLPFLSRVYASTRAEELAVTSWTEAQKTAFLDMQFRAQHTHYRQHYAQADWLVVMFGADDIGRLYVERWRNQYGIIDISFLPAYRGKGFGAALLGDIIDEASTAGKAVSIHVEKNNPARRLYTRLGFVVTEDKGVYDLMIRSP